MDEKQLNELIMALKAAFGENVGKARTAAGFKSQEKAAEQLGIKRGSLKEIERGASGAQFRTIVELSELFRVPPSFLFPDYLLSDGSNDRDKELKAVLIALAQLNLDDLISIRLVAEAFAERRTIEK